MGNPTPPPSSQIATIPDLPTASALSGAELLWINQAGLDRSAAVSAVAALGGAGVYLPLTGGSLSGNLSVSGSLTVGGMAFGTTPNAGDNSAAFATTAFVANAIAGISGVSSWNGRTGPVTLTLSDVTGVGGATAAQLGNYLPLVGGAISGALSVGGGLTATTRTAGDSTTNVATTAFVAAALPVASTTTPLINGTAAVGVGTTWARADHVHPTDTSRAAASALAGYLPLTGGTLTGPLNVASGQLTTLIGGVAITGTIASGADSGMNLAIDAPAGTGAGVKLNAAAGQGRGIQGFTSNSLRWAMYLGNPDAESGSNSGSNFMITGYSDSGSGLGNYLTINRSTGNAVFSNNVNANGGNFFASAAVGSYRGLYLETAGSARWFIGTDATAESGGNVGSNLIINSFNDAGAGFGTPFSINRTSGNANFSANLSAASMNVTGNFQAGQVAIIPTGSNNAVQAFTNASASVWEGQIIYNLGTNQFILYNSGNGGGQAFITPDGMFNVSGATAYKPGGGSWTAPSDERIKTVLGDYSRGLDDILGLRPVTFTYKGNDTPTADVNDALKAHPDDPKPTAKSAPYPASPHFGPARDKMEFVGFIAQEVQPVFPDMVSSRPGFIDGKPVDDLLDVDTTRLVYALVNAVKELAAKIEALKTQTP